MSSQSTVGVDLNDIESFAQHMREEWRTEQSAPEPPWLARACVPLDCMGGFAEYGGSLTLSLPTAEFVCCAAQARNDQQVRVSLMTEDTNGSPYSGAFPLALWYDAACLLDAAAFRKRLEESDQRWAWPALGVLHGMLSSGGVEHLGGGLNLALASGTRWNCDGRSTVAAAAATAAAASCVLGITPSALEIAHWTDGSERRILGLPCGFSGALCALSGEAGSLLQVRSQPQEGAATMALPAGITFVGVDCGTRHPDAERKYRDARTAAFMGQRIIERLLAAKGRPAKWSGHLARVSVNDYVESLRDRIPTKMKGRDFTSRFGSLDDALYRVEDDTIYKIRSRTEHHIYENSRVHEFVERISRAERSGERGPLLEAGELMFASHWSYGQRCGLGSIETDRLVNLLRQRGPGAGIFGAKISGCGAGGTVAVLLSDTDSAHAAVRESAAEYACITGQTPRISRGTSDGALVHGVPQVI